MKASNNLQATNGTSFHNHTFIASVNQIEKILGKASYEQNGGWKVNFEWVAETNSGHIFTIYDYKEYRTIFLDESIRWHIGGHSGSITEEALSEIKEELEKL
jgi:hypothetical protein